MNCFNCQKLDWEIDLERGKKGVSWWKVISGVVIWNDCDARKLISNRLPHYPKTSKHYSRTKKILTK